MSMNYALSFCALFLLSVIPVLVVLGLLGIHVTASTTNAPGNRKNGLLALVHLRNLLEAIRSAWTGKGHFKNVVFADGYQVLYGLFHVIFLVSGLMTAASLPALILVSAIYRDLRLALIYGQDWGDARFILLAIFLVSLVVAIWSFIHVYAQRKMVGALLQLNEFAEYAVEQMTNSQDPNVALPIVNGSLDYIKMVLHACMGRKIVEMHDKVSRYMESHKWADASVVALAVVLDEGDNIMKSQTPLNLPQNVSDAAAFLRDHTQHISL